jgi:hypothetical protein
MILAERPTAVQTLTPQQAYRAHLFSDCQPCAGGHWCAIRDRLDYLAAVADTRKGARRDR